MLTNIEPCSRIGLSLSLMCQPISEDIKQHLKEEGMDVKQHSTKPTASADHVHIECYPATFPPCQQQSEVRSSLKLQTLVYNILPSTTAVFSYAIESRKLSANEQVFFGVCVCSNSSTFVTNNSKLYQMFVL